MGSILADIKDLLIVFFVGLAVGYLIRGGTATARTYSNVEEWEVIKDEDGRVRGVRIHRKAEAT